MGFTGSMIGPVPITLMETTHEADFVESFDVIWERVCRDIFSMIVYAIIS